MKTKTKLEFKETWRGGLSDYVTAIVGRLIVAIWRLVLRLAKYRYLQPQPLGQLLYKVKLGNL